jgi:hypothetical protein
MGHFVFKAIWWFWIYLCLVYAVYLMCRATALLAFLLSLSRVVLSGCSCLGGRCKKHLHGSAFGQTLFMRTSIHEDHSLAGLSG